MEELTFTDRLIGEILRKRSILNVGLDPQLRYMPSHLTRWAVSHYGKTWAAVGQLFVAFNRQVIDAVEPFAISVKPQIAFYEEYGHWGLWAFEETIKHAKDKGLIVITDAKRGDGGDTAEAYADGHIGKVPFWGPDDEVLTTTESPIRVDALTVQPWIGSSCLMPFLTAVKRHGTGVFVVDKTSFAPNSEIEQTVTQSGLKNWEVLAGMVGEWGKGSEGQYGYRNFGVVMGATYPEDAGVMRIILPNSWFLVPGYGTQGGGADGAVVGVNPDGLGCVVNSSRATIYAYHPVSRSTFQCEPERFAIAAAKAAQFAQDELNAALKRAGKPKF